ncbi:MAG: DNA primase [Patescibacteria group bacterium]
MGDIEEVKSRTNIIDLIGAHVTLKKAGRHFKGLCPFHSEKTPSFIVSPERQSWKCFGCGKGGSVIDFVMENERVDFVEALETLAEKVGVKLERRTGDTPEAKLKERIYEANHLASEYYHFLLTKHAIGEHARAYLKTRGVTDKTIKTFILGYSPNSWDGLLKYLKKKGYDEQVLDTAGLIVPSRRGGYDRFRGRIMFTLKDHRGNIVGFSGRLLDPDAKEAKYINTSETPVYSKGNVLYGLDVTKAAIQKSGEAIVMEGEFDVISSFQAGVGNSVAIKGSALTEGHVHLLRRFAERLIFALDSDVAGDAAARRGIEIADRVGLDMRVVELPSGKDPDEAARGDLIRFKKALKEATPIYDYFISSVIKRFDPTDAYGKKKISEELLPIFSRIENSIVQGHYVKKLAGTLGVSEDAITDGMQKTIRESIVGRKVSQDTTPDTKISHTREENLELYILALVLQGKTLDLYEQLHEEVRMSDFSAAPVRQILEQLDIHLREHSDLPAGRQVFLIKDFADRIPGELSAILDEAFLWDLADALTDENRFSKQWEKALTEFKRVGLRRHIFLLTKELTKVNGITRDRELAIQQELRAFMTTLNDLEKSS